MQTRASKGQSEDEAMVMSRKEGGEMEERGRWIEVNTPVNENKALQITQNMIRFK